MDVSIVQRRRGTRIDEKPLEKKNIDKCFHKIVGTPDYMAPEMIDSTAGNSPSVDWWAIGCIIYEFIVGIPPFNDESVEKVWENVKNKRITWPEIGYEENCMSPEAKDLIEKLLEPRPEKRLTSIKELKLHPFFKGIDWDNIKSTNPPMVPKLNNMKYDKTAKIPLEDIFETSENQNSSNPNKLARKFKAKEIGNVRHDVLHEENLNHLVEVG